MVVCPLQSVCVRLCLYTVVCMCASSGKSTWRNLMGSRQEGPANVYSSSEGLVRHVPPWEGDAAVKTWE